ncbi:MAG: nickel-dependent lactate racemase [Candidatus Sumerlaeaceae bacterium]|nr:nickel-dependent lactate racemase [Candidatus Sumerlaeaceae bacterium]
MNHGIRLPYGYAFLEAELPLPADILCPAYEVPDKSEKHIVELALDAALGAPPLEEIARGRKSAVILIACRTRRTGSPIYVPAIVERLLRAGIPPAGITVVTATGSHDNFRPQDAELLLGPELAKWIRLEGHDCHSEEKLRLVGTTSRGTDVWLSTRYLDADLKIATGRVTCHYFAGFSGGRKAVLPGVSSLTTIRQNHSFAVLRDPEIRVNPLTANGVLAGNPIHEDMVEAAKFAPPDFTLNTVLDAHHRIVAAFGGDMVVAHERAAELVRQRDFIEVNEPYEWLIVSSGGAPYDVNGIQAIKAPINNYKALRDGGVLILISECPEGISEWLLQATEITDPTQLRARIRDGTLILGHNALWLEEIRRRATVIMVTATPPQTVARLGFEHASSLAAAVKRAMELRGTPRRIGVVPLGTTTVVSLKSATG